MRTKTPIVGMLLTLSLALAGCTIQPAVPTSPEGATAPGVTIIVTDTTGAAAVEAGAAVTEPVVVAADAEVVTTTAVVTTTVLTVTEGAVITGATTTDADAAAAVDTAADAGVLPTATPAAAAAAPAVTATTLITATTAGNILDIVNTTPGLETLATALSATGVAAALDVPGPVTLFAPNNDAFAALPADQLNALMADPVALTPILQYHIVIDNVSAAQLGTLGAALSSSGLPITVTMQTDGSLLINDASVVQADIPATNGTIHIVGGVLIPPAATP